MRERKQEWYKCNSWKLKRFIDAHGVYPVSTGVNGATDKVYHIYEMNGELSRILSNWSERKHIDM